MNPLDIKIEDIQKKDGKYFPENKEELTALVKDETISLGNIDTSRITDMSYLFASYSGGVHREDYSGIETWDTSNVKNMEMMFEFAENFNAPIGRWNTSNVLYMDSMFDGAYSFDQPLNEWDVSKVKYMNSMFSEANAFNQPLDQWDTSSVVDMHQMFFHAKSFNQPLASWDMSNVVNMRDMFLDATNFKQDLSAWQLRPDIDDYQAFFNSGMGDKDLTIFPKHCVEHYIKENPDDYSEKALKAAAKKFGLKLPKPPLYR